VSLKKWAGEEVFMVGINPDLKLAISTENNYAENEH
jgi:hypothetical protein